MCRQHRYSFNLLNNLQGYSAECRGERLPIRTVHHQDSGELLGAELLSRDPDIMFTHNLHRSLRRRRRMMSKMTIGLQLGERMHRGMLFTMMSTEQCMLLLEQQQHRSPCCLLLSAMRPLMIASQSCNVSSRKRDVCPKRECVIAYSALLQASFIS